MQHAEVVQPGGIVHYLIPIVVVAIIFAFRARTMARSRPLKLRQLWIVPALYAVIVLVVFAGDPPTPTGWLASVAGLAVGGLLGWWRGKTVAIHVDPVTRTLSQKASPLGVVILLGLVVAKQVAQAGGHAAHFDVRALTDALLAMALGTFTAMRVEIYLRAKRLVRSDRAERFG